jgi:transposase
MSASVLYHGWGVRGFRHLRTQYLEGKVIFHIERAEDKRCCAGCGSKRVIKKGFIHRDFRTLPIGRKRVILRVRVHRLLCGTCGALKQESLSSLAFARKHWTKTLGRYIVDLMRHSTLEDVARHLDMTWDTVKDIHTWALTQRFKRRRLRHLRRLAVDEVAVRKRHRYLTVVLDHDTGQVVWVGQGRDRASLEPFLVRLKRARVPIQAIAMDMWRPYIEAAHKHLPGCAIVFDHYHVIANCNKMLDELRRREAAGAPAAVRRFFKGSRFLLLKGAEKLQDDARARGKLDRLLDLNRNLCTAYILKEDLRSLWTCNTRAEGEDHLESWLETAYGSGIDLVHSFADMIQTHRDGILNYFDHQISTGKLEGTNNKIKVLKRKAYGFRDMEYFKLRIYFIHECRYAIIG